MHRDFTAGPIEETRRPRTDAKMRVGLVDYWTRTNKWSSRYALEKSPSLKRRNWTFHRPGSVIRKMYGWVQFWPSARVTLNVDQVVRFSSTVSLNPEVVL